MTANNATPNESKFMGWIKRAPFWVIVLIGLFLALLHYGRFIACMIVVWVYAHVGNVDLACVWMILATLSLPDKGFLDSHKDDK